jgi:hypothetical protein
MSQLGQKRSAPPRNATSDLPRTTDIIRPAPLVRLVPTPEVLLDHLVGAGECYHSGIPAFLEKAGGGSSSHNVGRLSAGRFILVVWLLSFVLQTDQYWAAIQWSEDSCGPYHPFESTYR